MMQTRAKAEQVRRTYPYLCDNRLSITIHNILSSLTIQTGHTLGIMFSSTTNEHLIGDRTVMWFLFFRWSILCSVRTAAIRSSVILYQNSRKMSKVNFPEGLDRRKVSGIITAWKTQNSQPPSKSAIYSRLRSRAAKSASQIQKTPYRNVTQKSSTQNMRLLI